MLPQFRLKKGKPRRGHGKGQEFERSVCKRLSLWVSNFEKEDLFWRSSISGARSTLAKKRGKAEGVESMAGDIVATHPLGHDFLKFFTVECKFYADIEIGKVVFIQGGTLLKMWAQAQDEVASGREPLLVVKQNFQPELVGVNSEGLRILRAGLLRWSRLPVRAYFPIYDLYLLFFRDVLTEVSFSRMKKEADLG